MNAEPKPKEFDNVEDVVHHYFADFELHEADQEEKSPREEGIELADKIASNLEVRLREASKTD